MRSWMIAFSLGIALASLIPDMGTAQPWWLLAFVLLPALALRKPQLKLAGAYSLGLFWGLGYAWQSVNALLPQELESQDIWVWGQVDSLPQQAQRSVRVQFQTSRMCPWADLHSCSTQTRPWPRRILLSDYAGYELQPGQSWRLQVRLKRPHGFANPGGFDYEGWLFQQNVSATGYIRENPANNLLHDGNLLDYQVWRYRIRQRMDSVLADSTRFKQAGLIKALTIGDRYAIAPEQWSLFSATGTTHLVVISGLHVGMMAMFMYYLALVLLKPFSGIMQRWPAPVIAAVAAVLAALCYSALAGFSLPTRRAFIMVLVLMWGKIVGRETRAIDSLCLAMGIILLLQPLAVQSSGFWLSFTAVAVLLSLARFDTDRDSIPLALWQKFRLLALAQIGLFIGLAPLMLIVFQQISLLAPLVNLLAIPLVSMLVVPLSLAGLGLLPILSKPALACFQMSEALLALLMRSLDELVSLIPYGIVGLPALPVWGLALIITGSIVLLLGRGRVVRAAGLACLLPLGFSFRTTVPPGNFQLHILDVGQGLAIVVQTANHAMIYDTGPAYSERFDAGSGVVLPFLQAQNIKQIDRVMISHGDNDHAGGLPEVSRRFNRALFLESQPGIVPEQFRRQLCRSAYGWQWDAISFTVLHPDESYYSSNNGSCVLRISNGRFTALLAGDIERSVENKLRRENPLALEADILVAPHHGSNSSSTQAFINTVNARHVVFASGYLNAFNHPHPDVQARYTRAGSSMLNTAVTGAITFAVPARGILPAPLLYRHERQRYWTAINPAENR
ncbi:MAG: DNA internalization-related competence protein ComEC/Rec2 [Pseudohongiellaceae bacterium]